MIDWNLSSSKPQAAGTYRRRLGKTLMWTHWNGEYWGLNGFSYQEAPDHQWTESRHQHLEWREPTLEERGTRHARND